MLSRWLKRFLPSGLQGRAILILLVPVVAVQLVVSVVFIQRHFDRVTEQMTRGVAISLNYLLEEVAQAPSPQAAVEVAAELGPALGFRLSFEAPVVPTRRERVDLSGLTVIRTFAQVVPGVTGVDLIDGDWVVLSLDGRWGPTQVRFPRGRVSASNPHQLLVIMVFAGMVMTLVAFGFLRNQLRPITRLAAAAEAYGRGQIVPYRPRGAVEVRAAGEAFLDMRARIERAREGRTLLLSGVSHDLRTPLTRLRLGLSLTEESEENRAMIRDVADMERMLEDFLAAARGEMLGEGSPVRPADIARGVVENAARMGREVALTVLGDAEAEVTLRPGAVKRALENLVQNALRYARKVAIELRIEPERVVFLVRDDGPGIPPERREEALAPFTRLDPARNQDMGVGAGLGLAIANDVARGHGGSLKLDTSVALGGLRAEMVLPRG